MASQREIFNKFKSVKSAQSLPPYESPVSRSMDNMNMTDFLFELIKQSKGQDGLKNVVLKSTLGELNNNANINNRVFQIIQEMFFCFFDIIIPENVTEDRDGIIFNISEIDITNMLSVDPNSPEGRHIYEGNDPSKHLNYLIYTAFTATESQPVTYIKHRKTIFTMHYLGGNQFKLHIGAAYRGAKLSEWAQDYLQDVSFFNMPNFTAQLVDIITGVVSIKTGQNTESIQQNGKIQQVMKKLFGFCKANSGQDGAGDGDETNEANNARKLEPISTSPRKFLENQSNKKGDAGNLFKFNTDEMLNIQSISDLRSEGKVRFSTCGNFDVVIKADSVFDKMDKLFSDSMQQGTVKYKDPNDPSQELTAQSFDNDLLAPDINNTATFLNDVLMDSIESYVNDENGNADGSVSADNVLVNLPNMAMEFEMNIVKAIPFAMTQLIISPQLLLLIKISSYIIGEEDNEGEFTTESIVNKLSKFITKIGDEIWNSILQNIFNILIKDMTNILSGLATKYLTQRFSDYASILSFIMNLINKFSISSNGCSGMLDMIMKLLSLNYFGPTPPVPPPLVFVGGMLKPGLNEVSVINDMKSQLNDKGIETGAYMSDGTPNYLMAAMEVQTSTLIKHIKTDSKIDVMTNGISGPTIGYGQLS